MCVQLCITITSDQTDKIYRKVVTGVDVLIYDIYTMYNIDNLTKLIKVESVNGILLHSTVVLLMN